MMIHAYQESLLSNLQSTLGEMFDYAINIYGINGETFIKMFIISSTSKHIENGEYSYLKGKSGIDLVKEIVSETLNKNINIKSKPIYSKTPEYWIGYAISYYQWHSNRKFKEIFSYINYIQLQKLYYTLHEADISKFVETLDDIIKKNSSDTNLKKLRTLSKLSQSELSKYSNVNLRSIQMYEQRNKNINKASGETLYNLSKVIGCSMEDLLEH